ncbi:PLP-dependent aminotransferase family protein [Caballeronia grimmiae]|uniref:Transcriptional regulator n=1 Tax=Caballeronia grimmiae TaxID=1071679 RepID=A0A069NL59_9BURK|nr:PLP-dependent aminotransferase family protein [Caballeronia grimmiae]KDR25766.1 GntR family transcriptional regulator [Caballeronia grimmiae]GGD60566.1 transcriptional regulator [Caballeronia grimmiae]
MNALPLRIDGATGVPLTEQIVSQIEAMIRSRRVLAGAKLPSIRQLAAEQRISRFPVIEAYDRLASRGLIQPKHGSGFYVANRVDDREGESGNCDPRLAEEESNQVLQQFNYPGETLKLSSGFIPEAWRDLDGLTQAIRQASRSDISSVIDYAIPHGDASLRQQVTLRLNALGIAADLPNVMITNGASQALDLIVRTMLKPGDTVFVEDPGYYNLFGLLKLQGVRLVGVPRLANGPDVDAAEALLKQHKPKLFFVNTVFQNPTATNIAPQIAFKLLQLATLHGFSIVEDDIYADFQAVPTQRLASLDQLDRVIYVGGLSKTLSSSLRIGYLAANRQLVKGLVDVKVLTSLGGTRFAESVAASLLERGTYRKYLERLRKRVRDSLSSAVQQLEGYGWTVFDEPSGGSFVWASVPGIGDSAVLVDEAVKFGVTLAPGSYYRPNGEACPWVRINSAYAGDRRASRFFEHVTQKRDAA